MANVTGGSPPSFKRGTSGPSVERDHRKFVPASPTEVTPAHLEKRSKSAAASKTRAGGAGSDNSVRGNEAWAQ